MANQTGVRSGLGPVYIRTSCQHCHPNYGHGTRLPEPVRVVCCDLQARRLLETGIGEEHPLGERAELRHRTASELRLRHDGGNNRR